MIYRRKTLSSLEKCYAVSTYTSGGEDRILFASEIARPALAFDGQTLEAEEISVMGGGTMSMVPLPGSSDFLAIENFFPPFAAAGSKLVRVGHRKEGWHKVEVLALPYLHRFGLLPVPGGHALILSVLCEHKADKDDWSSPGLVYTAPLDLESPLCLEPLLKGLPRNHGFFTGTFAGRPAAAVASDRGVHLLLPPVEADGSWEVRQLIDVPAGEVWLCDLDGDGLEELVTIEPFHGTALKIYHQQPGGSFSPVWTLPEPLEFAHALWCGPLWGSICGVCGSRRGEAPLFRFFYEGGTYRTERIESGASAANIAVGRWHGQDCLLSANHGQNQCVMYLAE